MDRGRAAHVDATARTASADGLLQELRPAPGIQRWSTGTGDFHPELVLRLPQVREAVGATAARLMFSLHIDTARTWRGGQNQVLVTVLGLRALGHRTVLVAHAGGELRQRAAEGMDLIPLAPRMEMDLGAAWRLSRIIKELKPAIVHAHDPHGVAMAALAL